MVTVTVEEAQEQWQQLLEQAHRGEEILIMNGIAPMARLLPPLSETDPKTEAAWPDHTSHATLLAGSSVLRRIWDTPAEDEAWRDL